MREREREGERKRVFNRTRSQSFMCHTINVLLDDHVKNRKKKTKKKQKTPDNTPPHPPRKSILQLPTLTFFHHYVNNLRLRL